MNEAERLLALYRTMARIRAFENAAEEASRGGVAAFGSSSSGTALVRGPLHLSTGQEAVAAGVCACLARTDYLTSTHRGHGHTLAKGADTTAMMCELFGRATGTNHGKGGSMHIADFSVGTPVDNHALLTSAMSCGDPVIYMEHKMLWSISGEVDPSARIELGKAQIVRPGSDITLVTWSKQVQVALEAAQLAEQQGISVEVIDLRTLWPWDRDCVLASAARTGRALITHEAVQAAGFGAEIAATIAEELGIPVRRVGAPRIPAGYANTLEVAAHVPADRLVKALLQFKPC